MIPIFWHIYFLVFSICNLDSLSVLRMEILWKSANKVYIFHYNLFKMWPFSA